MAFALRLAWRTPMPPRPAKLPLAPRHPERTCWGCDKYCPADSLACGTGTIRTLHPIELFGEDWLENEPRSTARRDQENKD